ncbi:hypothetical protein LSTR_LSTR003032 [Laodelphax striatellus]|uniref:Uncharacterized protein n=1 Tax=Laodelphax striatellus TaxID=195883 RepID=A0A482XSY6_LAOST|nr:hypothetical protein LSTR_LSTR003032 [Laodelphax striatellus]
MSRKSDRSTQSIDSLTLKSDNRLQFKLDIDAVSTLILLLYRIDMIGMLNYFFIHQDFQRDSKILHLIILYCICLPLLYPQILLGHYSKTGCMVTGKIVPLVNGVGFTMAVMSFINCIYTMVIATNSLIFFYYSLPMPGQMPWLVCDTNLSKTKPCYGYSEMEACQRIPLNRRCMRRNLSVTRALSAYHYRRDVLKEVNFSKNVDLKMSWFKISFSAISCVILGLVTDLNFKSGKASKVILIIRIFMQLFVLMIVTLLSTPANNYSALTMDSGFLDVFRIHYKSLLVPEHWMFSSMFMVQSMNVVSVGTSLIGSYMPRKSQADLFAFEVSLILLFLYFLGDILISTCMSSIAINLRVRKIIQVGYQDNLFVVIPQVFGMSQFSPKLLTMIFYGYLFFTSIWRAKLILSSIYETFADIKPIIRIYQIYIRTFSCILILMLSLPLYMEGFLTILLYFLSFLEFYYLAIIHMFVTFSILYIYGAQKICDDHHFIYGKQPDRFYRVMLILTPLLFLSYWGIIFTNLSSTKVAAIICTHPVFHAACVITLIPHLLGMLYKVMFSLKQQNMIHLLKCEDDWGDPTPQIRQERIIYHPRKENKYFRRLDKCKHDCLRYKHILPLIVAEEAMNHRLSFLLQKRTLFTKSEVGIGKLSSFDY